MSLKIGSVSLSIQEIKKLKPLGILIPDHISYIPDDQESTGLLMFGSTPLFVTKIVNNQIQIVDSMTHFEESMKENISNPEETLLKKFDTDTEEAVSIKEVPLEITVELARFTMPLKELLQLKAGNVLELPHHAEQRISLSLNGKKIGHGELVTLGDLLAIKIIDL
jgi:flagellar motor switch protein FliN/FliY